MNTEALIATLAQNGAAKPMPHPLVLASRWFLAVVAYYALMTYWFGLRPDFIDKLNEIWYLAEVAFMLSAAMLSLVAASFLALPDSGQKPWLRFVPLAPLAVVAASLVFFIVDGGTVTLNECLRSGEYECMIHLLFMSIAPAAFLFLALRKTAPYFGGWAGAMVGLAAGSFGYVLLRLVEASDDALILGMWHLLPVSLITVLCMLLGQRMLRGWART